MSKWGWGGSEEGLLHLFGGAFSSFWGFVGGGLLSVVSCHVGAVDRVLVVLDVRRVTCKDRYLCYWL